MSKIITTTIIIIITLFFSFEVGAQTSIQLAGGYNDYAMGEVSVQTGQKTPYLLFGYDFFLTRASNKGAGFFVLLGGGLDLSQDVYLEAHGGYEYTLRETGCKECNHNGVRGDVRLFIKTLKEGVHVFAQGAYTQEQVVPSIGVKIRIEK